jgi:exonuclease SbcD
MPFRFVHAADIHLDSPLRSLALRDPALAELIGNATRRAFTAIVDLCIFEQVDALMLSGDLYDGEQTSMKTARFLANQISRLHQAGIRAFVIRGNHDALSKITQELALPESVTIFRGRAGAIAIERERGDVPIVIHGISFRHSQAPESLLGEYKSPTAGAVNIGLMHTSLNGSPGHDAYAPCSLADLRQAGYQYWGLGHIHKRMEDKGDVTVVMAGMPQGRDINEAGAKSVTLVTVMDDQSIAVEERITSVVQFERVAADLTGSQDWRAMAGTIERALGDARDAVGAEHLVARLHLTGMTTLAWQLRRDLDRLRAEAEHQAASARNCWIDKVEVDCHVLVPATDLDAAAADPLEELRRLMSEQVLHDDGYKAEIAAIAEELRDQLPRECRVTLLGDDAQTFDAHVLEAARDGIEDVLARLRGSAETGAE